MQLDCNSGMSSWEICLLLERETGATVLLAAGQRKGVSASEFHPDFAISSLGNCM